MVYRSGSGSGPPEDLEELRFADFRRRMPEPFAFVLDSSRPIPDAIVFVPRILGVIASLGYVALVLPLVVVPCAVPFLHLARGRVSTGQFVAELVFCLLVAAIPALLLWVFGGNLVRAVRYAVGTERGGLYFSEAFLLYREGPTISVCPLDALESLDIVPTVKRLRRGGTSRSVRVDIRSVSGRRLSVTFDRAQLLEQALQALREQALARGKLTAARAVAER